jgi:aminoglycoside phosphotransferase (APT) family kinase protein
LDAAVAAAPAFGEAADAPTHGDLWIENLLVTPGGEWFLLDWDGLALGDPALDWGMLFGPTRTDPRTAADRALPSRITSDPAVRERLAIYARASLLDWTLDPLSDWIGAGEAPEHVAEVRAEKERIHRAALEAYRRRYGAGASRS